MAKIYVKFNTAVIKEVVLDKTEVTFGRRSDNDIVIDHPTISGHHGKLIKEGEHYLVEDLNSTNGTFINGRRIKTGLVKDKDQIGVAGHIFDYREIEEAPAAPPAVASPAPPPSDPPTPSVAPSVVTNAPSKKSEATPASPPVVIIEDLAGNPAKPAGASPEGGIATIRIISGGVDGQLEITLKDPVTYVGTKQQASIKIKGFLAPDLAAAISKRQDGYFLKAIKSGYPKVNGLPIKEQILLENGAQIEIGGTNMVFVKTH